MSSILEVIAANNKLRTEIQGELRSIDEAATADNRDYTDDERATIDEKRSQLAAVDERITENLKIELRSQQSDDAMASMLGLLRDRETGSTVDTRSIGERFASDEYRSWADAGARGVSPIVQGDGMDFRSVTDVTTGASSAGAAVNNQRLARIGRDFIDRKTYFLDQIPVIPATTGSVEYVQDQTPLADMANKAVEVAEGGSKPQAGPTFAVVTEPTATIAAWVNVTRQAAADVPQMMGYLDGRLRYSLKRRADGQALNGDGSSPNLTGLLNRSGILTYAPGSTEARYKSIRHGITVAEQAETVPEIICLNPADAELFDLANEASAGLHAVPNVADAPPRTTWGLTQVRSNAIAAGTALLVDPMAVALFDRQQATAYMTDSHASNFTSNILTLLLEARLGLGLFDPKGVLKITFHD